MDLITGLPTSGSEDYDAVLTVIDRMTRRVHFWPTTTTVSAEKLATLMLECYLPLHGVPWSIITDRDLKFVSQFWRTYFQALGTTLLPSTAYHPQTDGLSERLNGVLEDYL